MPEYSYVCKCGYEFTRWYSIKEYTAKPKCPECKSLRTVRNYQEDLPRTFVKPSDDQINVGDLAQRNSERLSSDEKAHLTKKHNEYKYVKPTKELPKGMSRMGKPQERPVPVGQKKRDPKRKKQNETRKKG